MDFDAFFVTFRMLLAHLNGYFAATFDKLPVCVYFPMTDCSWWCDRIVSIVCGIATYRPSSLASNFVLAFYTRRPGFAFEIFCLFNAECDTSESELTFKRVANIIVAVVCPLIARDSLLESKPAEFLWAFYQFRESFWESFDSLLDSEQHFMIFGLQIRFKWFLIASWRRSFSNTHTRKSTRRKMAF